MLESLLHPAAVQQVHDAAEAHRVIEVFLPSLLHLEQDPVDVGDAELEVPEQVLLVHRELALDFLQRGEIVLEQRRALLDSARQPRRHRRADAERIEQLQLHASGRIERVANVLFERFEPARRPHRRVALLCPQRQPRAHREDLGTEPEQRPGAVAHERRHLLDLALPFENVDLVDDDDDFLAPAPDLFEERPLGLGERAIGGRHEQHEIRARHELGGDRLVLTHDRVGPRGVDDVDLAEQRRRRGDDAKRRAADLLLDSLAVLEDVDLRGRRRDSFERHSAAHDRIDECALAGVELSDDDEEEQLVELLDRLLQRLLLVGSGIEADQCGA